MKYVFTLLVALGVTSSAISFAANPSGHRTVTIAGTVGVGTLDSSIGATDDIWVGFLTNSAEGRKIFALCKVNDVCKVTGVVSTGQYPFFISVTKVKLVKRAAVGA